MRLFMATNLIEMDKESSISLTESVSVYQLIKFLCTNSIKDVEKSKAMDRLLRKLIATCYDVLLYSKNESFDYCPEELHSAILMKASKRYLDGTASGKKNYKKLEGALHRLELLVPNASDGFLKFLYLLSDMRYDNQDLNEYKDSFSLVKIEEDTLNICNFNSFKEPLVRGLDIDYRIFMLADFSPNDTSERIYISRAAILQDIIYAFMGVPSSSFPLVNSCLTVRKGLISDGVDVITLLNILEPVIKLGNSYIQLSRLPKNTNTLCSSSFYICLKSFLQLYLKYVLKLNSSSKPFLFTSLLKFIRPLMEQMEFFQSICNLLPNSNLLLQTFYNFSINDFTRPNTTSLVNIFLLYCCQNYFKFIDSWIFEGSLSKTENLFIVEDSSINVDSKEAWNKVYTYVSEYALDFLPCLDIFNCGKSVALLKMCSDTDPFVKNFKFVSSNRPRVKLCKNLDELKLLNEECNAYAEFIQRCIFLGNVCDVSENIYPNTTRVVLPPRKPDSPSVSGVNNSQENDNIPNEHVTLETVENLEDTDVSLSSYVLPSERNLISSDDFFERYERVIYSINNECTRISWVKSRSQVDYHRTQYLRKLYQSSAELTFFPNPPVMLHGNDKIAETSSSNDQNIIGKRKIVSTSSEDDSFKTCDDENCLENDNSTLQTVRDDTRNENVDYFENETNQIESSLRTETSLHTETSVRTETSNLKDSVKSESSMTSTQSLVSAEALFDNPECPSTSSDLALKELCYGEGGAASESEWDVSSFIKKLENIPVKAKGLFRYDTKSEADRLEITPSEYTKTHDLSNIYEDDIIILRKIIKDSVLIPLRIQNKLVNDALIRVFLYEKKMLKCVETLTNKFFLMDGNFSSKLVDELSKSIEVESPAAFLRSSRLLRLTHTIAIDSDKSLSFKVNFIPSAFDLSDPSVLSCLSLTYSVDWPLNLLITPTMIEKYDSVFAFLLCVERTFWSLKELYINLKNYSSIYNASQFRKIMSHRFIMMQFISVLKSYLQNEVVKNNWTKFHKDIHCVQNIESLYRSHVDLVKKVRFMCFLVKVTDKLHEELIKLLRVVLVYCRIARDGPWCEDEDGTIKHIKFARLDHYLKTFMELAKFIIKYIQKLVEFSGRSEFDLLLVMLTLNSFYLTV